MKNKITRKEFVDRGSKLMMAGILAPFVSEGSELFLAGRKIKIGLIGCGSVSGVYLPHLSKSPYVDLVSVCDIIPERAKKRAAEFNVPNQYTHIDQLLAGAPFDLMINLTNMQEHGRLNKQALIARKHVWSEKPMANTYQE